MKRMMMNSILLSAFVLCSCGALKEWAASEQGQATIATVEEKTPDVVGDVVSTLTGSPAIGEIVGYGAGAVVAGLLSILGLKKGKKVLNSIKDSPKGKYFG